jgi:hypothetical protein
MNPIFTTLAGELQPNNIRHKSNEPKPGNIEHESNKPNQCPDPIVHSIVTNLVNQL